MSNRLGVGYVDGERLRRALLAAGLSVEEGRNELDRINVFPVADGDTGSNLALTLRSIVERMRVSRARGVGEVAAEAAEAAVIGARGNSGMLLSQFLLGFAEALGGRDRVGAAALAAAFRTGAARLERALEEPVEGTILTVAREASRAGEAFTIGAGQAREGEGSEPPPDLDILQLLERVADEGRASLARTPELLPLLRQAGVVDAGAQGFVLLLESTVRLVREGEGAGAVAAPAGMSVAPHGAAAAGGHGPPGTARSGFRYCTHVLVRGEALPDEGAVRERLRGMGDSLVVSRAADVLGLHIHTDEPEEVFALVGQYGNVTSRTAEDMHLQEELAARRRTGGGRGPARAVGIVTDSACDLPDELLGAHGIRYVPLEIVGADRSYRDRAELSAADFHRELEHEGVSFTTSQPSPGAFVEVYRAAAEEAEAIVVVSLGSGLSGTARSARAAAELFGEVPVHLFDSQGISVLEGLFVLRAAELAESGVPPGEIVATLERERDRSGILLAVDRFDRLRASGRVGGGTAWVGTRLGLKPILRVNRGGKVERVSAAFGRSRVDRAILSALRKELDRATGEEGAGAAFRFGVAHVGAPEAAEALAAGVASLGRGPVVLRGVPATPAIANHVGLGARAIAWAPCAAGGGANVPDPAV